MCQPASQLPEWLSLQGRPQENTEDTHLSYPHRGPREWGYLYASSHRHGWGPSERHSFPDTSGLPRSGNVGSRAQRPPSGKARRAPGSGSLRGVSGQAEGMDGHPEPPVCQLRGQPEVK